MSDPEGGSSQTRAKSPELEKTKTVQMASINRKIPTLVVKLSGASIQNGSHR